MADKILELLLIRLLLPGEQIERHGPTASLYGHEKVEDG